MISTALSNFSSGLRFTMIFPVGTAKIGVLEALEKPKDEDTISESSDKTAERNLRELSGATE